MQQLVLPLPRRPHIPALPHLYVAVGQQRTHATRLLALADVQLQDEQPAPHLGDVLALAALSGYDTPPVAQIDVGRSVGLAVQARRTAKAEELLVGVKRFTHEGIIARNVAPL